MIINRPRMLQAHLVLKKPQQTLQLVKSKKMSRTPLVLAPILAFGLAQCASQPRPEFSLLPEFQGRWPQKPHRIFYVPQDIPKTFLVAETANKLIAAWQSGAEGFLAEARKYLEGIPIEAYLALDLEYHSKTGFPLAETPFLSSAAQGFFNWQRIFRWHGYRGFCKSRLKEE